MRLIAAEAKCLLDLVSLHLEDEETLKPRHLLVVAGLVERYCYYRSGSPGDWWHRQAVSAAGVVSQLGKEVVREVT